MLIASGPIFMEVMYLRVQRILRNSLIISRSSFLRYQISMLEVRIRSVTNDPATALAMKNLLHRMPLRHPQTPHPLGLIIARGMPQTFTAIGEDPHSRALTVLVSGNASIENIIKVRVIIASNVVGGSESD